MDDIINAVAEDIDLELIHSIYNSHEDIVLHVARSRLEERLHCTLSLKPAHPCKALSITTCTTIPALNHVSYYRHCLGLKDDSRSQSTTEEMETIRQQLASNSALAIRPFIIQKVKEKSTSATTTSIPSVVHKQQSTPTLSSDLGSRNAISGMTSSDTTQKTSQPKADTGSKGSQPTFKKPAPRPPQQKQTSQSLRTADITQLADEVAEMRATQARILSILECQTAPTPQPPHTK